MRFWPLAFLILASCSAPQTSPLGAFDIVLRYKGNLTSSQKAAFNSATTRWKQVIALGLGNLSNVEIEADACGGGFPAFTGSIKSVLIDAEVTSIDGTGGTLGEAGPCKIDTVRSLTRYGFMRFDSADLASLEKKGLLTATIVHEMGHVLGFGTLWDVNRNLIVGAGVDKACGSDPVFVGSNAVHEWGSLGGIGSVPVENAGGDGTCDGHWRDAIFKNELMTGFLDSVSNPLSRLTIASMQDLGYTVNYAAADAYSLPKAAQVQSVGERLETKLLKPQGTLP